MYSKFGNQFFNCLKIYEKLWTHVSGSSTSRYIIAHIFQLVAVSINSLSKSFFWSVVCKTQHCSKNLWRVTVHKCKYDCTQKNNWNILIHLQLFQNCHSYFEWYHWVQFIQSYMYLHTHKFGANSNMCSGITLDVSNPMTWLKIV